MIVNDVRIITLFELTGSKWRQMDVMLFLQNKTKFWFFKVLKIIVGEYFDSYSLMFSNSDVFAKTNLGKKLKIGQLCIWKLYTYNTVYYTQGNIYSRFIFTQFSLENIGICKQKMVVFKVILRIWRQQSHTLWNKLVTYQKLDLPIFSCNKKLFKVLDE